MHDLDNGIPLISCDLHDLDRVCPVSTCMTRFVRAYVLPCGVSLHDTAPAPHIPAASVRFVHK